MQAPSVPVPGVPVRFVSVPWRAFAFAGLLAAYILLIIGVVHRSPLLTIDHDVWRWDLRVRYPNWYAWIHTYVMLGQRGPATLTALPWFCWLAWKYRTARPLIMLGTALLALNISVGIVKLATGRLGPLATHHVHAVFEGGNIFPSGHTSNTVVLYGVIAMLAVSYRTAVTIAAVFISLTVGLSTIYLDTHWLTDVVGGWMAGGLVLLALPTLMPLAERIYARVERRVAPNLRRHGGPPARPEPPLAVEVARLAAEVEAEQNERAERAGSGRDDARVPANL
jgi:membrane-associated phospholipid phosphatase